MTERIIWPNKENFEKLTEKEARFIFDQAETQLKEVTAVGDLVVSRATTLLTLASGILIGLLGFAINRWQSLQQFDQLIYTSIAGMIYIVIAIWLLSRNIFGHEYEIAGSEPQALFVNEFFNGEVTEEKRIIHFYVSEFVNYQGRIERNKEKNINRWKKYDLPLRMIIFSPLVFVTAYFIINRLF